MTRKTTRFAGGTVAAHDTVGCSGSAERRAAGIEERMVVMTATARGSLEEELGLLFTGDVETIQDPYPIWDRLREESPVHSYRPTDGDRLPASRREGDISGRRALPGDVGPGQSLRWPAQAALRDRPGDHGGVRQFEQHTIAARTVPITYASVPPPAATSRRGARRSSSRSSSGSSTSCSRSHMRRGRVRLHAARQPAPAAGDHRDARRAPRGGRAGQVLG